MNFTYLDKEYEIIIIRKNNKNLYIRITDDLKIKVTCPFFYTNKMVLRIIEKNRDDVIKMIKKTCISNNKKEDNAYLGNKIHIKYEDIKKALFDGINLTVKDNKMLDNWYKKEALNVFKMYLNEEYYKFKENIPYPKLKVRNMKTRWGVCNRKDNSVTLNLQLIKKEPCYLRYVIVHELSHFVHFNHSKEFWSTVEKYYPMYKKIRKELKD